MSTIQRQDPGMTRHKELHFRVWTILINHEYSHVEAFHQNNSWFKKKKKGFRFSCGGQKIPFSSTTLWCEEPGDSRLCWRGQREAILGEPLISVVWTSTVTTRRLRRTHSPHLVGRRLKSPASQCERSPSSLYVHFCWMFWFVGCFI